MFTLFRQRSWIFIFMILFTTQLACQGTQGNPPATSSPSQPEETQAPAQVEAPATDQPAPNPPENKLTDDTELTACLGTTDGGLICLEGEGWQTFTQENSSLRGSYILDLARCEDGSLLVAHTSGIDRLAGGNWSSYEPEWGYSSPDAISCQGENGIWVGHFEGVSYYNGQAWEDHPSSVLATGGAANDLVEDLLVAPDGKVWVATSSSVAAYDGSTWTIFQEGQGFNSAVFFGNLAIDQQGNVWAAHSAGLLKYDGSAWTEYPNFDLATVYGLAVDGKGRAWIATGSGVFVFDGQEWTSYNRENNSLSSDYVRAIAVDGSDRVWVGTSWGLHIFDGSSWQVFRMDNAELSDNDIRVITVSGCCQSLPEPAEKPSGSMSGRVVYEDGRPLADAPVEVCVETLGYIYYGDTPCSGQPYFQSTSTDGDGNFSLAELPAGYYVITINLGEDWALLETELGIASERVPVSPGKNTYVGELLVKPE
jgi:hypothetical protein